MVHLKIVRLLRSKDREDLDVALKCNKDIFKVHLLKLEILNKKVDASRGILNELGLIRN